MKLEVYNLDNTKVGDIEVSDAVFGTEVKPGLHWEVVRYQMAKRRRGTHAVLDRKQVSGSTRKLYKQKGTGHARHGSIKAPNYVGGGVVFGPQLRDHSHSLNKKVRRAALRSALSEKAAEGRIKVVRDFPMQAPKTKAVAGALARLGTANALVVDVENANLALSVRNLASAKYVAGEGINVYDVLGHQHLVITEAAIRAVDGVLQP